jgi:uncharacterized protein YkwD
MTSVRSATRRIRSQVLGALLLCVATAASLGIASARPANAEDRSNVGERDSSSSRLLAMGDTLLEWTNDVRDRNGRRPLRMRTALERYATRHAARMAAQDGLFHSTASQMADALSGTGWSMWGENVGMAPTLRRVERAFLGSAPHRENILQRAFDHAGIGVVRSRGMVWVTVDFYGA